MRRSHLILIILLKLKTISAPIANIAVFLDLPLRVDKENAFALRNVRARTHTRVCFHKVSVLFTLDVASPSLHGGQMRAA